VEFEDIVYEKPWKIGGAVRIMINRPKALNAFRGKTAGELEVAFRDAVYDDSVGVIVLTGAGDKAFCVGGDARDVGPGKAGYSPEMKKIFEVHRYIREAPKPVIAAVNGWAIGGGHVLHVICDLTIAADNAILGQNGPRIASPIHGYLVSSLAHVVGIKKAKEIWLLCRQYTAQEAREIGLVNVVVPLSKLEETVDQWCEDLLNIVPTCLALIKKSFVSIDKYLEADMGKILNEVAPDFFTRPEVAEAHEAFFQKRTPEFWKEARKAAG